MNAGKMVSMIVSISRTLNTFRPFIDNIIQVLVSYQIYWAFSLRAKYTFE